MPASVHSVCSRPGPTPTSATGARTCSAMNCRYSRAASGRSDERAALAEILAPAAQLGQLGGAVVQHRLVVGEVVEHRVFGAAVARAHLDAIEARRARRAW